MEMTARNNNGNGNNGGEPTPTRTRRITADDLSKAAEAAREAATAASNAAEAVAVALESGEVDEDLIGFEEGPGVPSSEPPPQQDRGGKVAFEEFMAQLSGALRRAGDNVSVTEHSRWVKIESKRNGHKVYVAKGKNQVNRIETTLPPDLVPGAMEPDRKNGRIAAYLPADPKVVASAIQQLVRSDQQIRAPQRGGVADEDRGGGGGGGRGGGRPQAKFN